MSELFIHQATKSLLSQTQVLNTTPHNLHELQSFLPELTGPFTPASVLCGLVCRDSVWSVLLTQRAAHLRNHAGQISFPGGKIEVSDADPYAAALREAQEEIHLHAEHINFLGYLDPIATITGFCVYPAVAVLHESYFAKPDGVEVDCVFEAPLDLFLHAKNQRVFEINFQVINRQLIAF
jgi:8-oxo-dGTP pyrophosphatase MutT (NUDIX family)